MFLVQEKGKCLIWIFIYDSRAWKGVEATREEDGTPENPPSCRKDCDPGAFRRAEFHSYRESILSGFKISCIV
jgi:hypothetical protein